MPQQHAPIPRDVVKQTADDELEAARPVKMPAHEQEKGVKQGNQVLAGPEGEMPASGGMDLQPLCPGDKEGLGLFVLEAVHETEAEAQDAVGYYAISSGRGGGRMEVMVPL